jgi:transcriptional regulator with XRE-family HTH domain
MVQLSQIELAERAGLSKTALANIEVGLTDPRASTLVAIQRALEEAGAEFTNDARPAVKLKPAVEEMQSKNHRLRAAVDKWYPRASVAARAKIDMIASRPRDQLAGREDTVRDTFDSLRERAQILIADGADRTDFPEFA